MFKELKKVAIYSLASLLLFISLSVLYIYFPKLLDKIDASARDAMFLYRGEIATSDAVFIVDIDEKALKALGQWPWSREMLATMLDNLSGAGVAAIGLDIVFAEEDRLGGDEIFARSIASSPTILGYAFDLGNSPYTSREAPNIPAIFVQSGKDDHNDFVFKANGTTLNTPPLQQSGYSSGFFNIVPDEAGIIRSVPLLIEFDDSIYPSLALELVRATLGEGRVTLKYDENGASSVGLGELSIPTDRYARMFINYRGGERSFEYISAIDIINANFDPAHLEGRIALVGTSAAGLFDLRATPFDNIFAGVEVHANIIDNILGGDFLQRASWSDGANILLIFILSLISVLLITYTPLWLNPIILLALASSYTFANYTLLFTHGYIVSIIYPLLAIVIGSATSMALDYYFNIKKEQAIKAKFASKVSQSVMEQILEKMDEDGFSSQSKEVSIFFSDIRGFTGISERMSATELVGYLNRYMDPMSQIIIKHNGTIDKYIGDAIMAYYNAPLDVKHHADEALSSALEQFEALKVLNEQFVSEGLPPISIGIGINSGEVVVGEMGSSLRSDYTVIGDAINLGSRVESLCKFYGSRLNITNYTKDLLINEYTFRVLDLVRVKGKDESVEIYEVLGFGLPEADLASELDLHQRAVDLYRRGEFALALELFSDLVSRSDTKIYSIYAERCSDALQNPPTNFDGVYDHTTKG